MEMQNNQKMQKKVQLNPIHLEDNQTFCEIFNTNINSKNDEDEIINDNEDIINKRSTTKENQMLKRIN